MRKQNDVPAKGLAAFLRRVFFGRRGAPRAVWILLLGCALYVAWAFGVSLGLTRAFTALFSAWGLTQTNLALAPAWARLLAENYGSLVSLFSSLGVIALSLLLLRLLGAGRTAPRLRPAQAGVGAGIGVLVVLLSAGLFLLTDSMRLTHSLAAARPTAELLLLLIVYLAAACAEEAFNRAFVLHAVGSALGKDGWRDILACCVSALLLVLTTGSLRLGAIGALNMLLLGFLCAWLHLHGFARASLGFRFGWSFASVALCNFPGGNAASKPLLALYHVSEAWLTGGARGLICGLWMTLLLALALATVLLKQRHKK